MKVESKRSLESETLKMLYKSDKYTDKMQKLYFNYLVVVKIK